MAKQSDAHGFLGKSASTISSTASFRLQPLQARSALETLELIRPTRPYRNGSSLAEVCGNWMSPAGKLRRSKERRHG